MPVNKRELWQMYTTSGKQFLRLRNHREARRMFEAALATAEEFGPTDPRLGVALNNLARVHRARRRYDEAETLLRRALDVALKARGQEHPDTAVNMANLAGLYQTQERYDEAERLLCQATEVFGKTMGEAHPSMARLLDAHASVLGKMGRDAEAADARERAERIRARGADPDASA